MLENEIIYSGLLLLHHGILVVENTFSSNKEGDSEFGNGRSHCFVFLKGSGSNALCLKISSSSYPTSLSIVRQFLV
ncbi:unnamed protein product [Cuscuta campestris]|uniref:Uncharacterized protein n=1 Tax=Cuscuta campestris TaxID=132261 RepID=A0A484MPV3_9ASTE|nr:unnamed protein product [Cuscuta campestris]